MRRLILVLVCVLAAAPVFAQHQAASNQTTSTTLGSLWATAALPPFAINPSGPADSMTTITDATGYYGCWLAVAANNPSAAVTFSVPPDAQASSNLLIRVGIVKNDAVDNTGTTPFQAKFRTCSAFGSCGAWTGWLTGDIVADAAGSTTEPDAVDAFYFVSWTLSGGSYNTTPGQLVVAQFQRNGGTSGSVAVCGGDLHYQRGPAGTTRSLAR